MRKIKRKAGKKRRLSDREPGYGEVKLEFIRIWRMGLKESSELTPWIVDRIGVRCPSCGSHLIGERED